MKPGGARYWKPTRRGDVYCSRGCGAYCLKTAHDRARKEARALVSDLGPGWKPSVWENMGWHYSVSNKIAEIRPDRRGSPVSGEWKVAGYSCWLVSSDSMVLGTEGKTPRAALKKFLNGYKARLVKEIGNLVALDPAASWDLRDVCVRLGAPRAVDR